MCLNSVIHQTQAMQQQQVALLAQGEAAEPLRKRPRPDLPVTFTPPAHAAAFDVGPEQRLAAFAPEGAFAELRLCVDDELDRHVQPPSTTKS